MRSPAPILFVSLFAAQAGFLVLGPILPTVADEFDTSTAAIGQLRTISGLAGGAVAVAMAVRPLRAGVRELLLFGTATMAISSLASGLAPALWMLAAAQVGVGAAIAVLLSAGVGAVTEWAAPENRSRVLAWTLVGQPAAWVVGMPVIGLASDLDWRWAFTVPVVASTLAFLAIRTRPASAPREGAAVGLRELWREPDVPGWALGELLAYAAWAGTLVFCGALLIETYDAGVDAVGVLLGTAALAYFPATFIVGRYVEAHARRLLVWLGLATGVGVGAFGLLQPGLVGSTAILAVAVFLAGGRVMAGSAFGLHAGGGRSVAIMSLRTAATQFGNLLGAAIGGLALATGGYEAMALAMSTLFLLAVVPHALSLAGLTGQRLQPMHA